jgi:menaquinone-dependent protoporphyrinogen oxidase
MFVLIAYASKHGSTREIATRIAVRLRERSEQVHVSNVNEVHDVAAYQAVIIGSAIYFGSWVKEAKAFVRRYESALRDRPVWLFSSGPVGDAILPGPKELPEFDAAIHPRSHRIFSGALDARNLSFPERLAVKAAKAPLGDFRDWAEIDAWADSIVAELTTPV